MSDIVERLRSDGGGGFYAGQKLILEAADIITALREATQWRDISTAPKDGTPFLVKQDGEIYLAKYIGDRMAWKIHKRWNPQSHRIIDTELDGEPVEARVLTSEGPATFDHNWTFWTEGFEFNPTHWFVAPPETGQ